jgi:hypothetical protein
MLVTGISTYLELQNEALLEEDDFMLTAGVLVLLFDISECGCHTNAKNPANFGDCGAWLPFNTL